MPFDQTPISDVVCTRRGADLGVSWASSAPSGSWHQIYLDRVLVWHGRRTSAVVPYPGGTVRVEVGVVPNTEATRDFSGSLPAVPGGGSRVSVSWLGGAFLGADILGFKVYTGDAPGGAVDYGTVVETVAAYAQGFINNGVGVGGIGAGGFGSSAGSYSWTSGPLGAGTWNVAVKPFDSAGNEGSALVWSIAVSGPPAPVAPDTQGRRLTYTSRPDSAGGVGDGAVGVGGFGSSVASGFGRGAVGSGGVGAAAPDGRIVTLNWLASPGA